MTNNIILLSGFAGSGKDTVGQYIVEKYGYTRLSFAEKVKDVCSTIFEFDRSVLEGLTKEDRASRESPDELWSHLFDSPFSMRDSMIDIAMILRNHYDENIWVYTVLKQIIDNQYENVVITDNRFTNEIEVLKKWLPDYNIVTVNVQRNAPKWYKDFVKYLIDNNIFFDDYNDWQSGLTVFLKQSNQKFNITEMNLIGYDFDKYIYNEYSTQELYVEIDYLMEQI